MNTQTRESPPPSALRPSSAAGRGGAGRRQNVRYSYRGRLWAGAELAMAGEKARLVLGDRILHAHAEGGGEAFEEGGVAFAEAGFEIGGVAAGDAGLGREVFLLHAALGSPEGEGTRGFQRLRHFLGGEGIAGVGGFGDIVGGDVEQVFDPVEIGLGDEHQFFAGGGSDWGVGHRGFWIDCSVDVLLNDTVGTVAICAFLSGQDITDGRVIANMF